MHVPQLILLLQTVLFLNERSYSYEINLEINFTLTKTQIYYQPKAQVIFVIILSQVISTYTLKMISKIHYRIQIYSFKT